ncbi:MAG TPA: alpha/beta hydrolase [Verrucomicrobiae bacterium]|nr:alpha/beta hydrolase [Verrucomicrobiae bacterium]
MKLIHALIWIAGLLILILLVGMTYQRLGESRDRRLHPPPGKFVDLGTHRLHLLEEGRGSPTIILEAGLMSTNLSWTDIRRKLAASYRVVTYDRAGLGWSDIGPMPRTAERIVDELHSLLELAAIPAPYVLVGHSFGGLTMPLFAARYPEKIAGMVLVDPVVPAEWNPPSEQDLKRSRIGAIVCRRAALLSRAGVIRFVASLLNSKAKKAAAHIVRLISRGTPADSGTVSSPWFWNLPPNERQMASVFWVQEKFCDTIASQLENLPGSAMRIAELNNLCDEPVVILSAKSTPPKRREQHILIAQQLPQGRHVLADKSTHWIMQDQPELVLDAIHAVAQSNSSAFDSPPVVKG